MADQNESSFKALVRFALSTIGFVCCITLAEGAALAQSSLPPTARVVGHVFCADTKAPARLATVTLRPVPARTAMGGFRWPDSEWIQEAPPLYTVMTDKDGAFAAEPVESGFYYVLAELPGYLNQVWQFTEDELKYPSSKTLDLIDHSFPKVKVDQGQTAEIEIQLQRGAALNGNIRYDDGSPAVGLTIQLLREHKEAKQGAEAPPTFRLMPFSPKTDDWGYFRIAGLPAGNVIVKCTLRQVRAVMPQRAGGHSILGAAHDGFIEEDATPEQTIDIYSGGVFHNKDATPIKLAAGAEVSGTDIVIPVDKIYRVSGLVASLEDDHTINRGLVELLYAEDGLKVSESKIGTDGSFHFAFVPKGEYQLSVSASDVQVLNNWSKSTGRTFQAYEPSKQPLSVVDHDLNDVVVHLKPKSSNSQ